MFGHIKFLIRPYILGGEDPKEGSNFGHFSFLLKFGLACRKIEASQGFWYQGIGANVPPSLNRVKRIQPFGEVFLEFLGATT